MTTRKTKLERKERAKVGREDRNTRLREAEAAAGSDLPPYPFSGKVITITQDDLKARGLPPDYLNSFDDP